VDRQHDRNRASARQRFCRPRNSTTVRRTPIRPMCPSLPRAGPGNYFRLARSIRKRSVNQDNIPGDRRSCFERPASRRDVTSTPTPRGPCMRRERSYDSHIGSPFSIGIFLPAPWAHHPFRAHGAGLPHRTPAWRRSLQGTLGCIANDGCDLSGLFQHRQMAGGKHGRLSPEFLRGRFLHGGRQHPVARRDCVPGGLRFPGADRELLIKHRTVALALHCQNEVALRERKVVATPDFAIMDILSFTGLPMSTRLVRSWASLVRSQWLPGLL